MLKKILVGLLLTLIDIEYMHYSLNSCPLCVENAYTMKQPFFLDENQQQLNLTNIEAQDTHKVVVEPDVSKGDR